MNFQDIKEFIKNDETPFYASVLSFVTVFAIVPTLLILISVLTYIAGIDKTLLKIKSFIFHFFIPIHQDIIEKYIDGFFHNWEKMGTMGLIYIFVASMLFFLNYETVVSKIFKTQKRNFLKTFALYLPLIIFSPIVLSLSFYFSNETQKILLVFGITKDDIDTSLAFFLVWLMFFINYAISLSIKIALKHIVISSFCSAFVWYLAKEVFIFYIAHNTTYSSLYGSFSVVLTFLLWIYISWIIYIYGLVLLKKLNKTD